MKVNTFFLFFGIIKCFFTEKILTGKAMAEAYGFTKNFTFVIDFFVSIVYDNIAKYGYQIMSGRHMRYYLIK